tara:strand:- start:1102 stop:1395 length:294 start_codon:yes stop_codon:yes gene_type:complete
MNEKEILNHNTNHIPAFEFYICFNDTCSYFGKNGERAAGDEHMVETTIPAGYYQGRPLCIWCKEEMGIAHTDDQANPPHIEWDGESPELGKYYQLRF